MSYFKYQLILGVGWASIELFHFFRPFPNSSFLTCIRIYNCFRIFALVSTDARVQNKVLHAVDEIHSRLSSWLNRRRLSSSPSKWLVTLTTEYENENEQKLGDSMELEFKDRQSAELYIGACNRKLREEKSCANYVVGLFELYNGEWKPATYFPSDEEYEYADNLNEQRQLLNSTTEKDAPFSLLH